MQIFRSHGVGTRSGGLFAVSLAMLALSSLVLSVAPAPSHEFETMPPGHAALRAVVDPETGALTVGTTTVDKSVDAELEAMLSRSTQGLRAVVYPHGGVGVNLQGRFQSASVARVDADGRLITTCSEHAAELEAFLHGRRPVQLQPELEVQ